MPDVIDLTSLLASRAARTVQMKRGVEGHGESTKQQEQGGLTLRVTAGSKQTC